MSGGVTTSNNASWSFGDRVRLPSKPEWGVGTVMRAEPTQFKGAPSWLLTIRFPNAGIKSLNPSIAGLETVEETTSEGAGEAAMAIAQADRTVGDDLLGPMAQRRLIEVMTEVPEPCRDPFRSLMDRVSSTLELYRFASTGRSLVDWAVAQTGLDDPLSRFNRQELEQHLTRWAQERDQHLNRLVMEARQKGEPVDGAIAKGPEKARAALSKARFRS